MPQVHTLSIGIKATAKQAMKEIEGFLGSLLNIKTALVAVGTAALGSLAVHSTVHAIREQADALDRMNKVARSLGVNLQDIRELEFGASLAGVDEATLTKGVVKMSKAMEEAVRKGEPLAGVLDASKLKAMSLGEQLSTVADVMTKIEHPAERLKFATDVFGKSGFAMMALFLKTGSTGLKNLAEQFRFLGGTISNAQGDAVEEANDNLSRMATQWASFKQQLAVTFMPLVSQLSEQLIPLFKTFTDSVQLSAPNLGSVFAYAAQEVARFGDGLLSAKANLIALKIAAQEQFNFTSRALYGVTDETIEGWKSELQQLEKELANRRMDSGGFTSFSKQFEKNREEWQRILAAAPQGTDGAFAERASLTPPTQPPTVKAHLTNDSIQALRRGTVEAATEVSRMQREALLEPQLKQLNKEEEARKQAMAEYKKQTRALEQIAKNTRNAVVLDEADLD